MTYTGILVAVAIGLIVGIAAQALFGRRPGVPGPLTIGVAVAAAVLGTVLAGLSDLGGPGYGPRHLALQVLMAMTAVTLTIAGTRGRTRNR